MPSPSPSNRCGSGFGTFHSTTKREIPWAYISGQSRSAEPIGMQIPGYEASQLEGGDGGSGAAVGCGGGSGVAAGAGVAPHSPLPAIADSTADRPPENDIARGHGRSSFRRRSTGLSVTGRTKKPRVTGSKVEAAQRISNQLGLANVSRASRATIHDHRVVQRGLIAKCVDGTVPRNGPQLSSESRP